jgi:hypothetical protein
MYFQLEDERTGISIAATMADIHAFLEANDHTVGALNTPKSGQRNPEYTSSVK